MEWGERRDERRGVRVCHVCVDGERWWMDQVDTSVQSDGDAVNSEGKGLRIIHTQAEI